MACRDIGAFRAEMAGPCGDYKSAECHTMARAAMRRYGTDCTALEEAAQPHTSLRENRP